MRGATSKKPGKRTEEPAPRPEYGRGTGVPNPIDVEVGGRIRTRRLLLGMNQQALADALDLTFQQVQKYEHGANRVSASRLAAMAKILAVPISYFFADLQSDGAKLSVEDKMWREQLQRPETIQLIRLYCAILNPEIRRQFLEVEARRPKRYQLRVACHARTGGRRQPERRRVGIDDGRAFLALAHMAAEREGLAEGEPALAGEAAHFPMAARRSEQSQLSGQAVAARNILRPPNQGPSV